MMQYWRSTRCTKRFAGVNIDHRAGRIAMNVTDHHIETDATVGQSLVQTVLLLSQLSDQVLALAPNEPKLAQFGGWHKGGSQKPGAGQHGQPLSIAHVGLLAWDMLGMSGIDHIGPNANLL